MSTPQTLDQILQELGWKKYHDCTSCPRNPQSYYSNDDHKEYDVRVRKRSNTVGIFLKNSMVGGPWWQYQAKEKFQSFNWV